MSNKDFQKLIDEYSLEYCHFLEAVYGEGMMSEGGTEAVEAMISGISLQNKTILEIGSGLGGAAIHLAKKFDLSITGIEINDAMVAEANKRITENLRHKVFFKVYDDLSKLPFPNESFDLIYTKGVLTHVEDKTTLFQEIYRILKPEGKFIINDWLSPQDGRWEKDILKMCEMENLTLYALSPESYQKILKNTGFRILNIREDTAVYAHYNQQLVNWLEQPKNRESFKTQFGEKSWEDARDAYQLIANSMKSREVLVENFICVKEPT